MPGSVLEFDGRAGRGSQEGCLLLLAPTPSPAPGDLQLCGCSAPPASPLLQGFLLALLAAPSDPSSASTRPPISER